MSYTVKQLADLAGVSARTLHYYDEIGLLRPETYGENGYRYYGEGAVLRLQQILFYKELELSLDLIREVMSQPDFDVLQALESHRAGLLERANRLKRLLDAVDNTILYLQGDKPMSDKQLFEGWSEEKQPEYEKEIREKYGEHAFDGVKDWNSYAPAQKKQIQAEGEANYRDLYANMSKGPGSPEVQAVVARWHNHLRYFYEPSIERLRGLSEMYVEDERFKMNFTKYHPDLAEFMRDAVKIYCDRLEGKKQ